MPVINIEQSQKEATARIKEAGIRKVWSKMKNDCIQDTKKDDPDEAKELEKLFDQGLGPEIDKYYKQLGKFPDIDMSKVEKHITTIKTIINKYQDGLKNSGAKNAVGLRMMLSKFEDIVEDDLKAYENFMAKLKKKKA